MNIKSKTISVIQISLSQLDNAYLIHALAEKIRQSPVDFFRHKPVVLDLSALPYLPSATELKRVKALFAEHHFTVIGVEAPQLPTTSLHETDLALIQGGMRIESPAPKTESKVASTQIVRKHIRSGERIYAENSDLIVIGNVNDSGEVHADGNILILGKLSGRAFAGTSGNKSALIYAQELEAQLVSIAGHYQNKEQLTHLGGSKQAVVQLDGEQNLKIQGNKTLQ